MNTEILTLQQQLSQFGLNPQDWILEKTAYGQYFIRHRLDFETYFKGLARKTVNNFKWKTLEFVL